MHPVLFAMFFLLTLTGCGAGDGAQRETPAEASSVPAETEPQPATDEFLWLENVDGQRALSWVDEQNQRTADGLAASPLFDELYAQAVGVLTDDSRIPDVSLKAGYVYNLWKDEANPRGLYRRMPVAEFNQGEGEWETVLDIDALSEKEGVKWVFRGTECQGKSTERCLVRLSPGGTDAAELREFNLRTKTFVDNGFRIPVGKHSVEWLDEDHLYLAADLGEGWQTTSGYPKRVVVLERGQSIEQAPVLFEGAEDSVRVFAWRIDTNTTSFDMLSEGLSFWERQYYRIDGDKTVPLELPRDASIQGGFGDSLVVRLYSDWQTGEDAVYSAGSLLLVNPDNVAEVSALFEPGEGRVLNDVEVHKKGIVMTLLDDVRGRVELLTPSAEGWQSRTVSFPDNGAIEVSALDTDTGDFFARFESFTTPQTLFYASMKDGGVIEPAVVRQLEPAFNGDDFTVSQHWVNSADGTRVPYYMVAPKGLELDGDNPVHIFSYGGFRNALTPSYSGSYEALSGAYGKLWLERGGVFVSANIRGGGEFGPEWHAAALRENRPRAFEDFEAIAEDLIERGVTTSDRIGIEGRSNGGLLVTATMVRRPDLYGAVICGVPLADMKRYHLLLAGASWMGEYGDPDNPDDWAFISQYSPYQLLDPGADYPATLFYTSTRDDRVHPGHARKMMARMSKQGHDAWYYENTEGGHGGSTTPEDLAYRLALSYTLLWETLGSDDAARVSAN